MANNKIIIGDGKDKDRKAIKPNLPVEMPQIINPDTIETPQNIPQDIPHDIPLDENVWGSDYLILNKLNEQQLAERRLFVRVIFMREIKCYETYKSIDTEAESLIDPIDFSITDISAGGIGIVSNHEIIAGTILGFKLTLDDRDYGIKCEVIYCFKSDNKFRAGLKVIQKDKAFIKHLKIVIARISLRSKYT